MTIRIPIADKSLYRDPDKIETRLDPDQKSILSRITSAFRLLNAEEGHNKPIASHAAAVRQILTQIANDAVH